MGYFMNINECFLGENKNLRKTCREWRLAKLDLRENRCESAGD